MGTRAVGPGAERPTRTVGVSLITPAVLLALAAAGWWWSAQMADTMTSGSAPGMPGMDMSSDPAMDMHGMDMGAGPAMDMGGMTAADMMGFGAFRSRGWP